MKAVLVRKLAPIIDGVDVAEHSIGEVLDLPPRDASLLMAEGWAVPQRVDEVGSRHRVTDTYSNLAS